MKSLSATSSEIGVSATVGAPPCTPGERAAHALDREPAHARAQGNNRWFAHLNAKSDTSPMSPIMMMPKMIWPVLSSAWLSVIMCPIPDDAPISSATIT